jgi:hypothetical protein
LDSASTLRTPSVAKPSAAPRRLQSPLIRGGGASDVHVSLGAGGGHGPTPAVAKAGGSAPECVGGVLLPLRRQVEAEQPLRRRARSAQPPRRACRTAW